MGQTLAEESPNREFEDDEIRYLYSAKAGFESEGCIRMIKVLEQTLTAELDTTHPTVSKSIEALKKFDVQVSSYISSTRKYKLLFSVIQSFRYDLSKDRKSLRVNSIHGGSSAGYVENLFGNYLRVDLLICLCQYFLALN